MKYFNNEGAPKVSWQEMVSGLTFINEEEKTVLASYLDSVDQETARDIVQWVSQIERGWSKTKTVGIMKITVTKDDAGVIHSVGIRESKYERAEEVNGVKITCRIGGSGGYGYIIMFPNSGTNDNFIDVGNHREQAVAVFDRALELAQSGYKEAEILGKLREEWPPERGIFS
ncbi:hypothetical protein KBD34_03305 [Patescibacteria group bacterium]|nr:hypothetical protein [Patescibacteria group bacterium]